MIIPKKSPTLRSIRTSICAASVHLESGQQVKKAQAHHLEIPRWVNREKEVFPTNLSSSFAITQSVMKPTTCFATQRSSSEISQQQNKWTTFRKWQTIGRKDPWNSMKSITISNRFWEFDDFCQLLSKLLRFFLDRKDPTSKSSHFFQSVGNPTTWIAASGKSWAITWDLAESESSAVEFVLKENTTWGFPKIRGIPTWMVYNGKTY